MNTVVLINPFEVSPEEEAAEYLHRQSGFNSTRLHKALFPDARFAYVNIAK